MGLQPCEGISHGIDYSKGILGMLNSQLTRLSDRRAIGSGQEDGVSFAQRGYASQWSDPSADGRGVEMARFDSLAAFDG